MPNPLTKAEVIAVLKEVYGDFPYEQLNHEARLLAMYEKSDTFTWEGDVAVENLHSSRNHSTKAAAEGGRLPTPQGQGYLEMRVPMRYVYGGISLTAQLMKSSGSNRGAFLNVLEGEVNGLVRDMLVECNRMAWGDGRGVLALMDLAGADTTTAIVDAPMGVAGDINGARFIKVDTVLSFHDAAPSNNVPNAIRTVTAVSADGLTLTLDAAISAAEAPNNGVVTKGVTRTAVSEGSWLLEPMGVLGLVDDATFVTTIHNINRSTTGGIYQARVISGVGSLDEFVFHRLVDQCDEAAGVEPDTWWAHHSVHRQYIEAGIADRRYTGEATNRPDLGIRGGGRKHELQFNGDTIKKERHCPYGTLYGIDTDATKRYEQVTGEWIDEDGAILNRAGDVDSFEAQYRRWVNYGMKRANSSCVARGISATIDIVNAE